MAATSGINFIVCDDGDKAAIGQAAAQIALEATAAKSADNVSVVISGGSFPANFAQGLQMASDEQRASTSKWTVYFADERCVPPDSDDSTLKAYQTKLAPHIQVPPENVVAIGDVTKLSPQQLADDYSLRLCQNEVAPASSDPESRLAFGAVSPLSGRYTDPNHPNGYRIVTVDKSGTKATVKVIDEPDDPEGHTFLFDATVDGNNILVDFSPKGGPPDLLGAYSNNGIAWPDGNRWPKVNLFEGIYLDKNHPNGYRVVTTDASGQTIIKIVDEKDNPEGHVFTLNATIGEDGTTLLVDFSPKGGPADLPGAYEDNGIRWSDGNKWPKISGGIPALDVIYLGMGPDGHTASLFPGHPLLEYTGGDLILSITDSPKPPPERITFSRELICAARQVVFVVTGGSKNEAITEIFGNGNAANLSAGVISKQALINGARVTWILDRAAAGNVVG